MKVKDKKLVYSARAKAVRCRMRYSTHRTRNIVVFSEDRIRVLVQLTAEQPFTNTTRSKRGHRKANRTTTGNSYLGLGFLVDLLAVGRRQMALDGDAGPVSTVSVGSGSVAMGHRFFFRQDARYQYLARFDQGIGS